MSFERGARPEEVVGTKYRVTNSTDASYENGEIVTLTNNDGTAYPFFIVREKIKVIGWHELSRIEDKPEVETAELDEDKNVNHPDHYNVGGIETLDYIKAKLTDEEYKGYLKGNSIKYLSRAGHKDKERQDIKKCVFYLQRLVEIL